LMASMAANTVITHPALSLICASRSLRLSGFVSDDSPTFSSFLESFYYVGIYLD